MARGNTVEVNIIGNESVSREIAKVQAALASLKDKTINVDIKVDKNKMKGAINDAVDSYNKSNVGKRNAIVGVDTKAFGKSMREAVKDQDGKHKVTVDLDVDDKEARSKLGEFKKDVSKVGDDPVKIKTEFEVDKNALRSRINDGVADYNKRSVGKTRVQFAVNETMLQDSLNKAVKNINDRNAIAHVVVDVDDSALDLLDARIASKDRTVRVKVVTDETGLAGVERDLNAAERRIRRVSSVAESAGSDIGRSIAKVGETEAERSARRLEGAMRRYSRVVSDMHRDINKTVGDLSRPLASNLSREITKLDQGLAKLDKNRMGKDRLRDLGIELEGVRDELSKYAHAVSAADRADFGENARRNLIAINRELEKASIYADRIDSGLDLDRVSQSVSQRIKFDDGGRFGNQIRRSALNALRDPFEIDGRINTNQMRREIRDIEEDFDRLGGTFRDAFTQSTLDDLSGNLRNLNNADRDVVRQMMARRERLKDLAFRANIEVDDNELMRLVREFDNRQGTIRFDFDYDRAAINQIQRDLDRVNRRDKNTVRLDVDVDRAGAWREVRDLVDDIESLSPEIRLGPVGRARQGLDNFTNSVRNYRDAFRDGDSRNRISRDIDGIGRAARVGMQGVLAFGSGLNAAMGAMTRGIPVVGATLRAFASLPEKMSKVGGSFGKIGGAAGGAVGSVISLGAALAALGTLGVLGSGAITGGAYATAAALGAVVGVASGITALAGAALAAPFVYFAAQAPEVSQAFKDLSTNVSDSMKNISKVVEPSMKRMATSLQGAFDIATPSLERMAEGTGQLLDDLGGKLPAISRAMGPALEKAFAAGATHLNTIASALPDISTAMGSFFDKMNSPAVQKAAQKFWGAMPGLIERTGSAIEGAASGFNKITDFLGSAELEPMRKGLSGIVDELASTDWTSASSGIANAMNSFGRFLSQVEGENVSQFIGGIADGFANLTQVATNINLDGIFAGVAGAFEGFTKVIEGVSIIFKPVVSVVEVGADLIDDLFGDEEVEKDVPVGINPQVTVKDAENNIQGLNQDLIAAIQGLDPVEGTVPFRYGIDPKPAGGGNGFQFKTILDEIDENKKVIEHETVRIPLQVQTLIANDEGIPMDQLQGQLDRLRAVSEEFDMPVKIKVSAELADQIEGLTGMNVQDALRKYLNIPDLEVEVDGIQVTGPGGKDLGSVVGSDIRDAINGAGRDVGGSLDGLVAAIQTEFEVDKAPQNIKDDINKSLEDLKATVPLVGELSGVEKESLTRAAEGLKLSIPEMDLSLVDNALRAYDATIKAMVELDTSGLNKQKLANNLNAVYKIIPEMDVAAADKLLNSMTDARVRVLPEIDPSGIDDFLNFEQQTIQVMPELQPLQQNQLADIYTATVNLLPNLDAGQVQALLTNLTATIKILPELQPFEQSMVLEGLSATLAVIPTLKDPGQISAAIEALGQFSVDVAANPTFDGIQDALQNLGGALASIGIPTHLLPPSMLPENPDLPALKWPTELQTPEGVPFYALPPLKWPTQIDPPPTPPLPNFPSLRIPVVYDVPAPPKIPNTTSVHTVTLSAPPPFSMPNSSSSHTVMLSAPPPFDMPDSSSTHTVNVVVNEKGGSGVGSKRVFTDFSGMAGFTQGATAGLVGASGAVSSFNFSIQSLSRSILTIASEVERSLRNEYSKLAESASQVLGDGLKKGLLKQAPKVADGIKEIVKPIEKGSKAADKANKKFVKSVEMGEIKHGTQTYKFSQKFAKNVEEGTGAIAANTEEGSKKIVQSQQDLDANLAAYKEKYEALPQDVPMPEMNFSMSASSGGGGFSRGSKEVAQDIQQGTQTVKDAADEASEEWDGINRKFDKKTLEIGPGGTWKGVQKFSQQYKDAVKAGIQDTVDWVDDFKVPVPQLKASDAVEPGFGAKVGAAMAQAGNAIANLDVQGAVNAIGSLGPAIAQEIANIPGAAEAAAKGNEIVSALNASLSGATANFSGLTQGINGALDGARAHAQQVLNDLGINFQIPPVSIPTEFQPPQIPQIPPLPPAQVPTQMNPPIIPPMPFIPPVNVDVKANVDSTLRALNSIPPRVDTKANTETNASEARREILALNGTNTSSTHTVRVKTVGDGESGGRGRASGFGAMAGFGEGFAGLTGMAGATSASSVLNISANIRSSLIEVINALESSVMTAWENFGLRTGEAFQTGLENRLQYLPKALEGTSTDFLSGAKNIFQKIWEGIGKIFGGGKGGNGLAPGIPTISVYEDGKLVAFALAEGIRDGDKWIVRATGELAGQVEDAIFHMPKVVAPQANKAMNGLFDDMKFGFGGIDFKFNFGDLAAEWRQRMFESTMRMSAGYLNEYGQWVVYHVNDNRTITNQFDGGLVGDPERQAKAVVDVLGQSPSAMGKLRMMTGSGRGI